MIKKSGYKSFIDLKYKPKKTDLICQFKVTPAKGYNFKDVVSMVAGESSVGTWTEVKTMNPEIGKTLTPKVYYLDTKNKRCRIAYPIELFELGNLPEIMSSIGGNVYGMKSAKGLRWEDIEIPKKMLKSFKGPRYGIKGIRKYLKIKKRPLVGTIVKPKVGLTESQHAKVAYESWLGGCDIVKDDENLTSQNFNKFKKRFLLTIKLLKKAEYETGEKKVYLINCTAETEEMLKRIKFVENNGGNYIMLDIITLGWGALQTARNFTKLPIHAHRAGHAMFDRNPDHGMSMEVIAQLARMVGVDTLHIGTAYGKMSGGKKEVLHLEKEIESSFTKETKENLKQKWYGIKPVFGVASGGVYPGIVSKIVKFMGNDVVLQAGGGIHWNPRGSKYGAMGMRQAVDAVMKNIPLKTYAKKHKELKEAIDKFGLG
ncbi:type III ribulose-bisphosphate carboxylase [Candidatus Pacearchaeota archaeon]|jgi:ribulose-bisphosphate carboxylase large chain|nr:type III ribulose-bisphosphate carboxylase [Candidatus Pacearchaeota archaeon]